MSLLDADTLLRCAEADYLPESLRELETEALRLLKEDLEKNCGMDHRKRRPSYMKAIGWVDEVLKHPHKNGAPQSVHGRKRSGTMQGVPSVMHRPGRLRRVWDWFRNRESTPEVELPVGAKPHNVRIPKPAPVKPGSVTGVVHGEAVWKTMKLEKAEAADRVTEDGHPDRRFRENRGMGPFPKVMAGFRNRLANMTPEQRAELRARMSRAGSMRPSARGNLTTREVSRRGWSGGRPVIKPEKGAAKKGIAQALVNRALSSEAALRKYMGAPDTYPVGGILTSLKGKLAAAKTPADRDAAYEAVGKELANMRRTIKLGNRAEKKNPKPLTGDSESPTGNVDNPNKGSG